MVALETAKKPALVWQGPTLDSYTLQLTESGLKKIVCKMQKQPELKTVVQSNYQGNLKQAVTRSIAQLAQDALYRGSVFHPSFNRKLRVFSAQDDAGRTYQILAFPISKIQSAIVAIEQKKQRELEEESGPAACAWLLEMVTALSKNSKPDLSVISTQVSSLRGADSIRVGLGQVKGKGTGKGMSNRPDISYYDDTYDLRVNIEIDTDWKRSQAHRQVVIDNDPNAVNIFLVVDPDTGELDTDLSCFSAPHGFVGKARAILGNLGLPKTTIPQCE